MSENYFQFRQFIIFQDKCSMKVTTDGVLLGAWADTQNINRALDVGTGSGLIALMIAQRSEALIDAVEIDPPACRQACENADRSPWKDRIRIYPLTFQQFVSISTEKYDLIISNPPFFRNALKSPDMRRSEARHELSLTHEELLKIAATLLTPRGRLCVILPYPEKDNFPELASIYGLHMQRVTAVKTTPHVSFSRILMSFGSLPASRTERTELVIHQADGTYSKEYIEITRNFYLYFAGT
jgi:tRNA1Val (adenine37-N6)-methyltransferase